MMVDPWLVIVSSVMWVACCVITCKLSERSAREWEKSANEWRTLAHAAFAEAYRYRAEAESARRAQSPTVTLVMCESSGLDGQTATQIGDRVH